MLIIGFNNAYTYRGYRFDSESGLYFLNSRYYAAGIGRFLTKDSNSYVNYKNPQTLNLYAYANGDPVNNIDPSGHGNVWDYVKAGAIGAFNGAVDALSIIFLGPVGVERVEARWAAELAAEGANEAEQSFLKMDLQLFAKRDIKQIESIAKEFDMTPEVRRDFGDYVESLKDLVPNNKNFSYQQLRALAKEFLGEK